MSADYVAVDLARLFAQPDPEWFYGLPEEKRERLIGWWIVHQEQGGG